MFLEENFVYFFMQKAFFHAICQIIVLFYYSLSRFNEHCAFSNQCGTVRESYTYKEITQFLWNQPGKWFDGSLTWNVDRYCKHIKCRWPITSIMWRLHESRGNFLSSFWIDIEYNTSTYLPNEFYVLICTSQ